MVLLDPTYIVQVCDYSFNDQSGEQCGICRMKPANATNYEFLQKAAEIIRNRNYMTIFIDNIRLYNRYISYVKDSDRPYVDNLMRDSDLLKLCSQLPDMKFIIFTGFEDTPIDDFIKDKIPSNVLGIYASNAISFGGKVRPIPYGLQRRMYPSDNRLDIIGGYINANIEPKKLLYINHTVNTNQNERGGIASHFQNKDWATINQNKIDYNSYLTLIKEHKFMICPSGNAVGCECHRDWEVLYMRRVPVVKDSIYLRKIFKGFPVLFVNDFSEVTDELLQQNNHLYEEALVLDTAKLDMEIVYKNSIEDALN